MIDRLEQAGMVARERCENDRRVIYVALTKEGKQAVERLDQPVAELHQKLLGRLSKTELKELNRILERVRGGLADEQGEVAG